MCHYGGDMRIALWAALVVPSLFVVDKVAGTSGAVAYALFAALCVSQVRHVPLPSGWRGRLLRLATIAAVLLVFALVYPRVNVHVPGAGSDDDDAYEIGARALLAARTPYASTTYLGNVLHQFAGSFVLALPFVLAGAGALQNPFWFIAFAWSLRGGRDVEAHDLRYGWLLLLTPVVLHQLVTGTGHLANAVMVCLGLRWVVRTKRPWLASAAWGVTLATRANFVLLLPLAVGWTLRRRGWRAGFACAVAVLVVFGLLVVPFYLHAPGQFGPLEASDRLTRADLWWPYTSGVAMVGMVAVSLGFASRPLGERGLMLACAAVQLVPILCVTGVEFLVAGWVDLSFATYVVFALPFIVTAEALSPVAPTPLCLFVSKRSQALIA